jgi:hypothetical protein
MKHFIWFAALVFGCTFKVPPDISDTGDGDADESSSADNDADGSSDDEGPPDDTGADDEGPPDDTGADDEGPPDDTGSDDDTGDDGTPDAPDEPTAVIEIIGDWTGLWGSSTTFTETDYSIDGADPYTVHHFDNEAQFVISYRPTSSGSELYDIDYWYWLSPVSIMVCSTWGFDSLEEAELASEETPADVDTAARDCGDADSFTIGVLVGKEEPSTLEVAGEYQNLMPTSGATISHESLFSSESIMYDVIQYTVDTYDNDEQFVLATRLDGAQKRVWWHWTARDEAWICSETALLPDDHIEWTPMDSTSISTGCGGEAWRLLVTQPIEISGDWRGESGDEFSISDTEWTEGTSSMDIIEFSNHDQWAVFENATGYIERVQWQWLSSGKWSACTTEGAPSLAELSEHLFSPDELASGVPCVDMPHTAQRIDFIETDSLEISGEYLWWSTDLTDSGTLTVTDETIVSDTIVSGFEADIVHFDNDTNQATSLMEDLTFKRMFWMWDHANLMRSCVISGASADELDSTGIPNSSERYTGCSGGAWNYHPRLLPPE